MKWGAKVSHCSQRYNYLTFSSSTLLSSDTALLSLCIYARGKHPKPQNTSALVTIPPTNQFRFGHLGNSPKISLKLTVFVNPSNSG